MLWSALGGGVHLVFPSVGDELASACQRNLVYAVTPGLHRLAKDNERAVVVPRFVGADDCVGRVDKFARREIAPTGLC